MTDRNQHIALVVAASRNGVIGAKGGLPWHIPSDLKRFKETTMGKPIIMGRKTWQGLPLKPLPGRENIVVSRDWNFDAPGAYVAPNIDAALRHAQAIDVDEIAVIGGGQIFESMQGKADRIYYTEIDMEAEGDTYFAKPSEQDWQEVSREVLPRGPKDSTGATLMVFDRRK